MPRFKSKAVFPTDEIVALIREWRALDGYTPGRALARDRCMELIAQKATPLFTAFAVGECYPAPIKFAELCRERVPKWVAALAPKKAGEVFLYFSVCTCGFMRQLQAEQVDRQSK